MNAFVAVVYVCLLSMTHKLYTYTHTHTYIYICACITLAFCSCPGILLPDTIVYRKQRMHAWFFMSGSNPEKPILMKRHKSTNQAEILKRFLKKENRSGVHACSLQSSAAFTTTGPTNSARTQENDTEQHTRIKGHVDAASESFLPSDAQVVDVEYHEAHQLRDFLRTQRVENSGRCILQRFVEGKGEYHTVLRATWSPQVCLLERRSSSDRLSDRRRSSYWRCATFDASLHDTPHRPVVGSALSSLVKRACTNIVKHVEGVTRYGSQHV